MIVVGIMFFTLGAEMSMTPMGERVGAVITKAHGKLLVILGGGFLLGFTHHHFEPDLQVLANQVPSIPDPHLILSVAADVGLFPGVCLPAYAHWHHCQLLVLFYGMIFLLAAFVPGEFLAVAFDSGGVTTGPMTVPFIMAH